MLCVESFRDTTRSKRRPNELVVLRAADSIQLQRHEAPLESPEQFEHAGVPRFLKSASSELIRKHHTYSIW
jgi:hypothetical protein